VEGALEIRGLTVDAGDRRLVSDLTFSIQAGEVVALTGPSGAGKTTVLRTLAHLASPAAGEIRLQGRSPEAWGLPAYRRRVAYVAQQPALLDTTVRANLARPFAYHSAEGGFDEGEARDLLARLGLGGDAFDQAAGPMSVGERQRVCLARALLIRPAFLLFDEPTSALDPDRAAAAEAVILDAVSAGAGAIVVSHDPRQRARLAGREVAL